MMMLTKRKNGAVAMSLTQVMEEKSRPLTRRVVFELLLIIAMSVGCWYTFFSMFPNPVDTAASLAMIIGLPVALYFLCWNPFLSRFLAFYVFLLTAVFFFLAYKSVWNGMMVMVNIVIEVLNDELAAGLIPFEVTGDTAEWGRDCLLAMIPIMLLASMAIVHSVYHKEPLLGLVLTALPVVAGLYLKARPSIWLLLLLFLAWTELLVLSAMAGSVRRKNNKVLHIQNWERSSLPYLFLSLALLLLLAYVLLFSGEDYRPPESVDQAKAAVIAAEEHLRYDKLGGEEIDQLTKGDLSGSHPMAYTEYPVFNLKMQIPQAMYLRGFVGGDFEKGQWKEAAEGAYAGEYTGAMEWLAQKKLYPWMQQDRLYRMSKDYDFSSVDVSNLNGNSKYVYLPYEAVMSGETMPDQVRYQKDYGAFAKGLAGQREYSFKVFSSRMEDYDEQKVTKWLQELKKHPDWDDYAEAEAVYRRFVYDTYLYVPEEEARALRTSGMDKCAGKTIEYTLHTIRSNFDENFTYDLEQGTAAKEGDELRYFLEESHSGDDMHFATAAALMLRTAGIPARYAEGYYLSPDYMLLYTDMSDVSMDVPDSLAHSWVEVYIDEIGWFPVEVIPGFFDMEKEQSQELEDDEKIEEETKTNYQDEAPEEDQPEQKNEEKKDPLNWLPFVLVPAILLLLIAAFEAIGRYRIRKLLNSFGTVHTNGQVYAMYRYVSKIMAFDKHPLAVNPYDSMAEISATYDSAGAVGKAGAAGDAGTGDAGSAGDAKEPGGQSAGAAASPADIRFAEFLEMVHWVRFGGGELSAQEHEKMARYVKAIAKRVYGQQKKRRKFLMKFILFYV